MKCGIPTLGGTLTLIMAGTVSAAAPAPAAEPTGTCEARVAIIAGATCEGHPIERWEADAGSVPQVSPFQLLPVDGRLPTNAAIETHGGLVSADGRYVVFAWTYGLPGADHLKPAQVAVWDRQRAKVIPVSVSTSGQLGNRGSSANDISLDGRYVLFSSDASNLVRHDTNHVGDAFVRDLRSGTTRRISISSKGRQLSGYSRGNAMTANGHLAFFDTPSRHVVRGDANGASDVFARNIQTGRTTLVSQNSRGRQGNGGSYNAAVSDNGKLVAFESVATNMAKADPRRDQDVFWRNRTTGRTRVTSVHPDGRAFRFDAVIGGISGDGRVLGFSQPNRGDLYRPYVYEQATHKTRPVAVDASRHNQQGFVQVDSFHGQLILVQARVDLTGEEGPNALLDWDVYAESLRSGELTSLTAQSPPLDDYAHFGEPALSRDKRTLVVAGDVQLAAADTDSYWDVYLRTVDWAAPARSQPSSIKVAP